MHRHIMNETEKERRVAVEVGYMEQLDIDFECAVNSKYGADAKE